MTDPVGAAPLGVRASNMVDPEPTAGPPGIAVLTEIEEPEVDGELGFGWGYQPQPGRGAGRQPASINTGRQARGVDGFGL